MSTSGAAWGRRGLSGAWPLACEAGRARLAVKLRKMHKQSIVRLWGLTAQRGWARLILDHLDALVHGSAATTQGNAAGYVDDAAEHYNFFNPDHWKGTTNSAGFGWRGGGA